jgi:hypothetical protein
VRKNFNPAQDFHAGRELPSTAPYLIKGTSRREKVRKNLNPPEKSKLAENSRSQPSTYLRNIQKSKTEEKSWY